MLDAFGCGIEPASLRISRTVGAATFALEQLTERAISCVTVL